MAKRQRARVGGRGRPARGRPAKSGGGSRSARAARTKTARAATPRRKTARAKPAKRKPAAARPRRAAAARPAAVPSGVGFLEMHLDYNSHLKDEVKRFYTGVLGFSDHHDDPAIDYLYIRTGPSSSLGFTSPQEGPPEEWRPPREPAIYLIVADVDRAHREASARGATFEQEPRDMPWGHRVATLRDPEGRVVYLAQRLRR